MKAICIRSGHTISPMGDAPLDAWFADKSFKDDMQDSLQCRGVTWTEVALDDDIDAEGEDADGEEKDPPA